MFLDNQDEQDDPECPKIMVLKDFIIEIPIYYTFWNPCDYKSAMEIFSKCIKSIKQSTMNLFCQL